MNLSRRVSEETEVSRQEGRKTQQQGNVLGLSRVSHHLQGDGKEKPSQTKSRQGGREAGRKREEGLLPEAECWNTEHAVLI